MKFSPIATTLGLVLATPSLWAQPARPDAPPFEAPAAEAPPESIKRELPDSTAAPERVLLPVAGGLTSDDVARRAVASSPLLRARQAEVDAANARVRQTMIQFFPRVTLAATYTRLSPVASDFGSGALVGAQNPGVLQVGPCPTGGGQCVLDAQGAPVGAAPFAIETLNDNYALTASATIPISDYVTRLADAAASSRAGERATILAKEAEKLKVNTNARVVYYGWVRASGQVTVARKSLERSNARLKDAQAAYTLGAISKADLLRLEALVANTEFTVKQAETARALAEKQLSILMKDGGRERYALGEDVLSAPRNAIRSRLEQLVAEGKRRRLEVKALGETTRAFQRGAAAQSAGGIPRLDAFGDVTYANPNQRFFPPQRRWDATWTVGLRASWLINDAFGSSAASAELEASAAGASAQRSAMQDGIEQEVTAAYLEREQTQVAIKTSARAVKATAEAYRVATDLYRVGRATTTELIEAESDLLNARLSELDAHIGLHVAEVRLRHAAGLNTAR